MDIHERDASYRRRIAVISAAVLCASVILVLFVHRIARRDFPKYVGWKGEMELLPEITIEPEVVAEAAPAPKPEAVPADLTERVAERSTFETAPPSRDEPPRATQPDMLDLEAHGAALSEAARPQQPVSYSDTYVILRMVKPRYPPREQAEGIEGNVTVELLVDEQGRVAQANVISLVGPESFQQSALDAVQQFLFQPPVEDGRPSSMWIKFVIKFRMYQ